MFGRQFFMLRKAIFHGKLFTCLTLKQAWRTKHSILKNDSLLINEVDFSAFGFVYMNNTIRWVLSHSSLTDFVTVNLGSQIIRCLNVQDFFFSYPTQDAAIDLSRNFCLSQRSSIVVACCSCVTLFDTVRV